jgi:hypothetical protein
MADGIFRSVLGTKMTLTLNKRLRLLRHRTARWFLPPPGRRFAGAPYEYEPEHEREADASRQKLDSKRLPPLN